MPGLRFEEFQVGHILRHGQVVASMEDNVAFCLLTRNRQPLHLDPAYAAKTPFGRVVINGLYTMSVAVGLSVEDTTAGTLVANLGYEEVQHPKPVFPGDTLDFETEVLEKRASSKPGRGVVTLLHRVRNQDGDEVCRFRRIVMVHAGGP